MVKQDFFIGATKNTAFQAARAKVSGVVDLAAQFADRGIPLGEGHEFEK